MTLNRTTILILDGDKIRDTKNREDKSFPTVEDGRMEWYVYKDSEAAGKVARQRWQDMAEENPPREFVAMIGDKRLVQWALGRSDEYGMKSLDDFLDAVEKNPAEELASYDGNENEGRANHALLEALGLDWDDSLSIDGEILGEDIVSGDLDPYDLPEAIHGPIERYKAEPTDANLAVVLAVIDEAVENGDDWADEILSTYTFEDVVAYRHN